MDIRKLYWGICFLLSILPGTGSATHIRSVEINVRQTNCPTLRFEITIIAYINYGNTSVIFGGQDARIFFGDGTSEQVPELPEYQIVDDALKVGRIEYKTLHVYAKPDEYILGYREANRNAGVLNYENSVGTVFYTQTKISARIGSCNTTPTLLIPPIDRACKGVTFYHNPGAFDSDHDSLSFELVIPQRDLNAVVIGYLYPHNPMFYAAAGIPYAQGNEDKTGTPSIRIDPDGTVVWDAPGAIGEYGIAIKVKEWRFNPGDSTWMERGFVIRDMQIIVEDCANKKPHLTVQEEFCVYAGTTLEFEVKASDPDGHPVKVEAFSTVFSLFDSPAKVTPPSGTIQTPNPSASIKFTWATQCEHIIPRPYAVVFKITDQPPSGPKLISFKTVNIKIIARPPEYEKVVVNPVTKSVHLQWREHECDNISEFQVWRRISRYAYEDPMCNNGMPKFLRYQLIATTSSTTRAYTDNQVEIGAEYCYRIVALVGSNNVPSKISLDTCLIPKPAEAPVITNVSVVTTGASGSIQVNWTKPFDIDQLQYPPPYLYNVHRGQEIAGTITFQPVTYQPISDTLFLDQGINTNDHTFYYRIELFAPMLTSAPLDTSSQASSVFLNTDPVASGIDLTWTAHTPWYNYIQSHPYHLIYRSATGPAGNFILIDSVNVNENDFHYLDRGQYLDQRLTPEAFYHYKVLTRGSYGNRKIKSPLENYSQIAGSEILDTIPPCPPVLSLSPNDCSAFSCGENSYFNELHWQAPSADCQDIVAYEILMEENEQGFVSLGTVEGLFFTHADLNSMAKCYRVIAIDNAGNKSDSSDTVCNDNCPYFELPNVFTPEITSQLNDHFTTYTDANNPGQCARFVRQVELFIYDRWGKKIYSSVSGPENHYLFWDGVSDSGKKASSGVYYYYADVHFDMRDPARRRQQFKGWVHLIR